MRTHPCLSAAAVLLVFGCTPREQPPVPDAAAAATAGPAVGSAEWKINAYSSAAPAKIGNAATVMDFDDAGKAQTIELRKGTNGWVCLPFAPPPAGGYTKPSDAAPMCGDAMTMAWAAAYGTKTLPKLTSMGLAYMLHGDLGASNNDPFATAATADNDWVVTGGHVMIFPVDVKRLASMPTDHASGGPYVMWQGTPYAHVMVPTASH